MVIPHVNGENHSNMDTQNVRKQEAVDRSDLFFLVMFKISVFLTHNIHDYLDRLGHE